jgi:phosphoribosylanthranilate isomerase
MKIKVCGMRQAQNVKDLSNLNPDYIGFIFYDKSKRFVADFPEVEIPLSIKKVGVFVNETIEEVARKISKYKLDAVQLHGDENVVYCNELRCLLERSREILGLDSARPDNRIEVIKAFAIDEDFDFNKTIDYESVCDLFLFDTKGKEYGGNGLKYDWSILKNYKGKTPFLLSGGINERDVENIKKFQHSKFVGIDLNSGFEDAPSQKNIEKLKTFFKEVKE